ncbi:MAG: hypothetical protein AAGM67_16610, partial [Bacteroidota bacterium]
VSTPTLRGLKKLYLQGNRITSDGLMDLFYARDAASLKVLDISSQHSNSLGYGLECLLLQDCPVKLETLILGRLDVDPLVIRQLRQRLPDLTITD